MTSDWGKSETFFQSTKTFAMMVAIDEYMGQMEETAADDLAAQGAFSNPSVDRDRAGPLRFTHERERLGGGLPPRIDEVARPRAARCRRAGPAHGGGATQANCLARLSGLPGDSRFAAKECGPGRGDLARAW